MFASSHVGTRFQRTLRTQVAAPAPPDFDALNDEASEIAADAFGPIQQTAATAAPYATDQLARAIAEAFADVYGADRPNLFATDAEALLTANAALGLAERVARLITSRPTDA